MPFRDDLRKDWLRDDRSKAGTWVQIPYEPPISCKLTFNPLLLLLISQEIPSGCWLLLEYRINYAGYFYAPVSSLWEKLPNPNSSILSESYKNAGTLLLRSGDKQGLVYLKKSLQLNPGQKQAETLEKVIETYN